MSMTDLHCPKFIREVDPESLTNREANTALAHLIIEIEKKYGAFTIKDFTVEINRFDINIRVKKNKDDQTIHSEDLTSEITSSLQEHLVNLAMEQQQEVYQLRDAEQRPSIVLWEEGCYHNSPLSIPLN